MLEKQIETKVVKWARSMGFLVLKLNGIGQRSWPDRLFISPIGVPIFIEFKRPGGKLSAGQAEIIDQLGARCLEVHVCYDPKTAIDILSQFI